MTRQPIVITLRTPYDNLVDHLDRLSSARRGITALMSGVEIGRAHV